METGNVHINANEKIIKLSGEKLNAVSVRASNWGRFKSLQNDHDGFCPDYRTDAGNRKAFASHA